MAVVFELDEVQTAVAKAHDDIARSISAGFEFDGLAGSAAHGAKKVVKKAVDEIRVRSRRGKCQQEAGNRELLDEP